MSNAPTLFDPVTVGAWQLPNRVVMAPLTRARALALTAVFAAIAGAASAGSVVLKSNPVDDDGRVTLGDLFEEEICDTHLQTWHVDLQRAHDWFMRGALRGDARGKARVEILFGLADARGHGIRVARWEFFRLEPPREVPQPPVERGCPVRL